MLNSPASIPSICALNDQLCMQVLDLNVCFRTICGKRDVRRNCPIYRAVIHNQLAQQEEDNNAYNSENVTENVWILQSTIEGDTLYVTAFKISGKPINILKHWSDRMASDIKSARKKEQYQKANAKYTELKSEIMKLSKEKKADLIKTLIK